MKRLVLSSLALIIFSFSFAQQIPGEKEIKNSGLYIYGIGTGNSYRQADNNALDNLITQISVHVESSFENFVTETDGNLKEYTRSIVKTYSNVTLASAESMLISEKKGKFKVMRYMTKTDLNKLFENRKLKIFDYVKSGIIAEKKLRIADALKNYYWALVLLHSHKDIGSMQYNFPEEGLRLLVTALPDKINAVFTALHFSIKSIEDIPGENYKAVYLNITFNGQPVENLDYQYWTGRNYSNLFSCRSGVGIVEFIGETEYQLSKIKLMVEYSYAQKTAMDLEVKAVYDNVELPFFRKAEFKIPLPASKMEKYDEVSVEKAKIDFEKLNKIEETRKIRRDILKIIEAIKTQDYSGIGNLFTTEGKEAFNRLIANGNVKVLPDLKSLNIVRLGDKTIVRSVPVKLSYKNSRRSFIENIVFVFNKDGIIESITFAISDKAINDIVSRSERFGTVEDKYELISFMENYKTAYCLKRLDYIEKIFADNALIIVGSLVKEAEPIEGMYNKLGSAKVKYIEMKKEEYIERLSRVFNSNEFVNIHFEDNIVNKVNGNEKIYGIQIKQDYYSTTYADKGYLFLMIDLTDTINPKIYVRTWQPEKNPDGSIYGLSDFEIN
jgi:hypothetical protein